MYKCIYKTNNISHIHVTCLEFSFFIHLLHFFKVLVSNAIYTEIVEQQEALILQGVSSGLHLEGDIVEMSLLFKNEAHIKFSLVHIFGEFCVHCLLFENNRCTPFFFFFFTTFIFLVVTLVYMYSIVNVYWGKCVTLLYR